MKTLIYIEHSDGKIEKNSLELISSGKVLGEVEAVIMNDEALANTVSTYGIDVQLVKSDTLNEETIVAVMQDLVEKAKADAVFFPATLLGKDLAPRLAAKLNTGCVSDVTEVINDKGGMFKRPIYGGTVNETLKFAQGNKLVATIRSGSYAKPAIESTGKVITSEFASVKSLIKLIDQTVDITETVNLEDASIIVSGGRGCQNAEIFKLVEELAKELGGVVGASRPAIEAGWVSRAHQIGQSGKNVAPKLYIACGISGAMQHISGISNSDFIVAINKDEDAPIFDVADIGIVGKVEDILPLMIQTIKNRKES